MLQSLPPQGGVLSQKGLNLILMLSAMGNLGKFEVRGLICDMRFKWVNFAYILRLTSLLVIKMQKLLVTLIRVHGCQIGTGHSAY